VLNLAGLAQEVLEPLVGETVANTCVRATAIRAGKTSDELEIADLPALEDSIRRLLAPVAPAVVIESTIEELRGAVA